MLGVVRDRADGRHPFQIPFAHIVLTARGSTIEPFLRSFEVGDRVGFSTDLVDLSLDCERRTGRSWSDAYASLGGGFVFLRNGQIRTSDDLGANTRDPRTAICLNEDFVYFVVVDGRQNAWSVGMTLDEVAAFCRDELAATWGVNQDGGGSSALWVDGVLRNRPSDGGERAVGNGWLMLSVQPARRSNLFEDGFRVLTQGRAVLRLGPGTEYEEGEALADGEQVTIAPLLADIQGVWVRGSYWWKVSLGEQEGWVPQNVLVSPDRLLAVFQIPPEN
ncbi:MAG: phosphodiester glycosidase family protein, partial [Anaerolineales bacterium]